MASTDLEIVIRAKNEASKVLADLTKKLQDVDRELKKLGGTNTDGVSEDLEDAADAAEDLQEGLEGASESAEELANTSGLDDISDDLDEGAESAKQLEKDLDTVAKAAGVIGVAITAALGLSIAKAGEFSQALAEVSTLLDTTEVDMDGVAKSIKDLSSEFGQDRLLAVKAYYDIISSGATAGVDANTKLEQAMKLALGGATDVATAADGLTTVLNAYNLETSQAAEVTDVMFATMKGGKTTIPELSASMAQVAPFAAALGVDFKEVSAAMIGMTKQGTRTSIGFTQLKALLQGLVRPTEGLVAAFKEYSGTTAENLLRTEGLGAAMEVLNKATNGNKGQLIQLLGSVEAVTAAMQLSGDNAFRMAEGMASVAASTGEADRAVAKMAEDPAHQLSTALKDIGDLVDAIGLTLLPALADVAVIFGDLAKSMEEWIKDNEVLAGIIIGSIAVFGLLATAIGALSLAFAGGKAGMLALRNIIKSVGVEALLTSTKLNSAYSATATYGAVSAKSAVGVGVLTTAINVLARATLVLSALWGAKKILDLAGAMLETKKYMDIASDSVGHHEDVLKELLATKEQILAKELALSEGNKNLNDNNLKDLESYEKDLRSRLAKIQEAKADAVRSDVQLELFGVSFGDTVSDADKAEIEAEYQTTLSRLASVIKAQRQISTTEAVVQLEIANEEDFEHIAETVDAVRESLDTLNDANYSTSISELERLGKAVDKAFSGSSVLDQQQAHSELVAAKIIAERRYAQVAVSIAERTAISQKNIIERTITDETERADAIKGVVETLGADRIAIAQRTESALAGLLQTSEAKYEKYAAKVKSLEASINTEDDNYEGEQQAILDKRLSDYQIYQNRREQLESLASEATRALINKDYDELEAIGKKQKALAKEISTEVTNPTGDVVISQYKAEQESLAQLKIGHDNVNLANKKRLEDAERAEKGELSNLTSLSERLNTVKDTITALQKETLELNINPNVSNVRSTLDSLLNEYTAVDIGITVDREGLAEDMQLALDALGAGGDLLLTPEIVPDSREIDDKISEIVTSLTKEYTVVINYKENNKPQYITRAQGGAVDGYATGGKVTGPGSGTSDSIMAMLSNGEYVIRAAAVQKYGLNLLDMINGLSMPSRPSFKFATGGLVGPDTVSSPNEVVDVNLTFNANSYELRGSREEVKRLTTAMKNITRGQL
ncbi:MAG: phage tail tape measure protein [Helicobacteraceae bacterium]|nr:phage tail tape measure protein [Helicobacteraceae bacterium]